MRVGTHVVYRDPRDGSRQRGYVVRLAAALPLMARVRIEATGVERWLHRHDLEER